MTRRITVLVGTDHHDFSRVVGWADDWQCQHPDDRVLVQHGYSPAPTSADGTELVPPSELVALLESTDVVVTHGGPGTIMSARHAGHHPVAVPRDPSLGEHVDEHQVRFVTWAAAKGLCDEARSVDDLSRRVASLGTTGTRTHHRDTGHALDPAALDEALLHRRPRRAPSRSAVRVLMSTGSAWDGRVPVGWESVVRLGLVSDLWLGDPDGGCSCGRDRRSCPFWDEVVGRAFDGWDDGRLDTLRTTHLTARSGAAAAVRRHPGERGRRLFLAVAGGYRRTARAALEASGAAAVVDEGGPLLDALILSHCRELDLRVTPGPRRSRSGTVLATALRYRAVPVLGADQLAPATPSLEGAGDHRLLPTAVAGPRGSIAR